jgi:hypothetical protein
MLPNSVFLLQLHVNTPKYSLVCEGQFYIQGAPKVGIQYINNYCILTFGPPCMSMQKEITNSGEDIGM